MKFKPTPLFSALALAIVQIPSQGASPLDLSNGVVKSGGAITVLSGGSVNGLTKNMVGLGGLTLGGNFTTSGSGAVTLTITGATNLTLPTSGTLLSSTQLTFKRLAETGIIFVNEGDSLSDATWSATQAQIGSGNNWTSRIQSMPFFSGRATFVNAAIQGQTLAQMVSQYSTEVHPYAPTGGQTGYFALFAGINDINLFSTNATTLSGLWDTEVGYARADGFKLIAFTVPYSTGMSDGKRAIVDAFNEHVRMGVKPGEYLVDVAAQFPDPSDTAYVFDGLHYNARGQEIISQGVDYALESGALPSRSPMNVAQFKVQRNLFFGPAGTIKLFPSSASSTLETGSTIRSTRAPSGGTPPAFEAYGADPRYQLYKTDAASDAKATNLLNDTSGTKIFFANDALGAGTTALSLDRSGTTPTVMKWFGTTEADGTTGSLVTAGGLTVAKKAYAKSFIGTLAPSSGDPGAIEARSVDPRIGIYDTDAGTNEKYYQFLNSNGTLNLVGANDGATAATTFFTFSRSGTSPAAASFLGTTLSTSGRFKASGDTTTAGGTIEAAANVPNIVIDKLNATTDQGDWSIDGQTDGYLSFNTVANNRGTGSLIMRFARTGTTPTAIEMATDVILTTAGKGVRYGSSSGPLDTYGSGSPEGVVTGPVGSTFRRTDGGAGTSFYVKESGSGNTGWVAK